MVECIDIKFQDDIKNRVLLLSVKDFSSYSLIKISDEVIENHIVT